MLNSPQLNTALVRRTSGDLEANHAPRNTRQPRTATASVQSFPISALILRGSLYSVAYGKPRRGASCPLPQSRLSKEDNTVRVRKLHVVLNMHRNVRLAAGGLRIVKRPL